MRKLSLKNEIIRLAWSEYPSLVSGWRIEKLAMKIFKKPRNASHNAFRICRELVNEGIFEVIYKKDGYANYKIRDDHWKKEHPTPQERVKMYEYVLK